MAQGDLIPFTAFPQHLCEGKHVVGTDQLAIMLVSDASIDKESADPVAADYTEVSGPGYTPGGIDITATLSIAGNELRIVRSGAGPHASWSETSGGPSNIRWGIVYNKDAANDEAIGYIDMRDGGSPVSIDAGDVDITLNSTAIIRFPTL